MYVDAGTELGGYQCTSLRIGCEGSPSYWISLNFEDALSSASKTGIERGVDGFTYTVLLRADGLLSE